MKNSARRYPQPRHDDCESLWKNRRKKCFHNSTGKGRNKTRLEDALLVKSAEYWLKLGEPIQALMELQQLPESKKKDPWVVKIFVSATGAALNQNNDQC